MSNIREISTVTIPVDLCNPGEFFACCGLLELAQQNWGCDALGWFQQEQFNLFVPIERNQLKENLYDGFTIIAKNDRDKNSVVYLQKTEGSNGNRIILDWWLSRPSFKTWSGNQSSFTILRELYDEGRTVTDIFSGFEFTASMSGRLSIDYRSSWTGLDSGFSPNTLKMEVSTYPFIEFLAAIGLQRFRPYPVMDRSEGCIVKYRYHLWRKPLMAPLACISSAIMPASQVESYDFLIKNRGKYKYFTKANKTRKGESI